MRRYSERLEVSLHKTANKEMKEIP